MRVRTSRVTAARLLGAGSGHDCSGRVGGGATIIHGRYGLFCRFAVAGAGALPPRPGAVAPGDLGTAPVCQGAVATGDDGAPAGTVTGAAVSAGDWIAGLAPAPPPVASTEGVVTAVLGDAGWAGTDLEGGGASEAVPNVGTAAGAPGAKTSPTPGSEKCRTHGGRARLAATSRT